MGVLVCFSKKKCIQKPKRDPFLCRTFMRQPRSELYSSFDSNRKKKTSKMAVELTNQEIEVFFFLFLVPNGQLWGEGGGKKKQKAVGCVSVVSPKIVGRLICLFV